MTFTKKNEFNMLVVAAMAAVGVFALMMIFGAGRVYADEITEAVEATAPVEASAPAQAVVDVVAVAGDADNDGIDDSVEAQIEAQQKAAEEAQVRADAEVERQKKAAEDARIQAEKEVAEKQKAIEEEQKRIEAEQKAREEEIARKKAEEEARKAAEEAQRKFEESLTASGMSEADFNALCKMVQAEDGHDTIEGRIGIANVILNRVRNPRFPNSIMGVISAPGQFGPFSNGAYAAAVPSASTVEAVKKAISGTNTVGGALYFHRGGSFNGKMLVASAGAHCFFA